MVTENPEESHDSPTKEGKHTISDAQITTQWRHQFNQKYIC